MKIAVYSGSFDPLHIGHLAIMEYLTREGEFDWVYLVISPQNPLKDPSKAASGRARYEAAVEAVLRHPELHVWVDDIELSMEPPSYTIRTLDALKEREPENDFTLVIGADNLASMRRWRDYRRILTEYGVVVYPRSGFDLDEVAESLRREGAGNADGKEDTTYDIRIVDAPMVDISSTLIREGLAQGLDMSEYLM